MNNHILWIETKGARTYLECADCGFYMWAFNKPNVTSAMYKVHEAFQKELEK